MSEELFTVDTVDERRRTVITVVKPKYPVRVLGQKWYPSASAGELSACDECGARLGDDAYFWKYFDKKKRTILRQLCDGCFATLCASDVHPI